jgi:hypothetical protein
VGHGRIQRGGNLAAQLHVLVQRTRQRRRLELRHAGFARQFADARGHGVHALGHDHRRTMAVFHVLQGHGEVAGVGDDHVGLGNGGHHAPAGHLALHLAHLRLQARVALRFALFLAHFLHRHLQAVAKGDDLIGNVDDGHGRQRRGQQGKGGQHQREHLGQGRGKRVRGQAGELLDVTHDEGGAHACQQDGQHQVLAQAHEGTGRNQALEPGAGVQAVETGKHDIGNEQPAADEQRRSHRGDQHHGKYRCGGQQRIGDQLAQALAHACRLRGGSGIELQAAHEQPAAGVGDGLPRHGQHADRGPDHAQVCQVARARNLSFLACVLVALGARV